MVRTEYLKYIKQLKIRTKKAYAGVTAGDYVMSKKGFGLEFNQIREYAQGDDVRYIDWKSSARMNKLLVKEYLDERNRTFYVLLDVSKTTFFGSGDVLKIEPMVDIASIITLAAQQHKDRVGLIIFDEHHLYKVVTPSQDKVRIQQILKELFWYRANCLDMMERIDSDTVIPHGRSVENIAHQIAQKVVKGSLVFMVSDFMSAESSRIISLVKHNAEVVALRCLDSFEKQMTYTGSIQFFHKKMFAWWSVAVHSFFTITKQHQRGINFMLQQRLEKQNKQFTAYGIDWCDVTTNTSFLKDLLSFFSLRMSRR